MKYRIVTRIVEVQCIEVEADTLDSVLDQFEDGALQPIKSVVNDEKVCCCSRLVGNKPIPLTGEEQELMSQHGYNDAVMDGSE